MATDPKEDEGLHRRRVEAGGERGKAPNDAENAQETLQPPQYFDYESADAYAQAVRTWLWAYHSWYLMHSFAPLHFMHRSLPHPPSPATPQQPFPPPHPLPRPQQQTPAPTGPSSQMLVASLGRRLLAEMVDFAFCFVFKLMIVYFMVELNFINLDKYEKLLGSQADLRTFVDVTQDLFPIEIFSKLLTSLLEALYISYGVGSVPPGRTPGKFLLGLKVVSCSAVTALAPRDYRILVYDMGRVSFSASLQRSLIKNICLSFLFPICVTMYAFRFNRALYDLAAGTVVVEA